MTIRTIKGFADMLYPESSLYAHIETIARQIFSSYMYKEIRTPLVEYTELFSRGIGDETDIIQKEMYSFHDKKGRSISLRPEATAGSVRAYMEHAFNGVSKLFTIGPMFRYERPQKGRMRQFHQVNCECFGIAEPTIDAEIIAMLLDFLTALGVTETELLINSLGCSTCRVEYKKALIDYLGVMQDSLCGTCKDRMVKNPLRVLDCKEEQCKQNVKDAPSILDSICISCKEHFEQVQALLHHLNIEYRVEPHLVRGLDYYSRTTFEVLSHHIGAQSAIAGGGRYDTLVEQMGGKPTPAIGFACGVERLLLLLGDKEEEKIDYYIVPLCKDAFYSAYTIAQHLRKGYYKVEMALSETTMKSAMKYAGKHAKHCILIGEDELARGVYRIKNMDTGVQEDISITSL